MRFKAENLQLNTLKEGLKVTIYIDNDERKEVLADIHNFIDQPLIINMNIDADTKQEQLGQITKSQRKHIYALIGDIANAQGDSKEAVKKQLKVEYNSLTGCGDFSLADCSRDLASGFIEFLLELALDYGIALSESPIKRLTNDDVDRYLEMCIKKNICVLCGKYGNIHHVDTYGMGANRNKTDDSDKKKIALCNKHHREAHDTGWETFKEKYKVRGIISR